MRVLYFSAIIVVIDQISKLFIKGINIPWLNLNFVGMDERQSINVIGDFFKITFVENPGMAFGIGVSTELKLLLSVFSLIASLGIIFYIYKSKEQRLVFRIALALILGGAIGNLIDRTFYGVIYNYAPLFYGNVVDFFNVEFFDFSFFGQTYQRFPIFNVADAAVSIGVVLLLLFNKDTSVQNDEESDDTIEIPKELENLDKDKIVFESVVNNSFNINDSNSKSENGENNNREKISD